MKKIVLFLCVLVFSIFSNTNNLLAKEIENNSKDNISNEIEEIKSDNKKTIISNSSLEDIFGDEQTFPFVAGLGKNAAHWFYGYWKCRKDFLILMKGLRVLELSEALNVDSADLLAVCAILKIKATSRLSMLSFEECKNITDYYENKD